LNVTFTDNSTDATSSLWYFGKKGTSTEKNPTFNFTYPGTYRVVLEVSNPRGWDATAQEINVQGQQQENVLPIADFDTDTSYGLNVQFVDTAQNANKTDWDFGDGTNSTDFSPVHTYSTAGTYTVNLTVSNANGTDSKTGTINVSKEPVSVVPVANFSTNVTSGETVTPGNANTEKVLVVIASDSGKTISLNNGETFTLNLRENPSTGYAYELNLSDGLKILSDKYTQDEAPQGKVGVPGTRSLRIQTTVPGTQTINGIYKRPWENITGTEEKFTLTVEVS